MLAIDTSTISNDLAHVVCRVESGRDLGPEVCDGLTRSLAQLFGVAEAACSDADRACFDRILLRIAPSATEDARLFLSDRLADVSEPPRGILLVLAKDAFEVARPILARSPALCDDDLIEIARVRGPGHMRAIAERNDLSLRITDVLVLRGDDQVRRIVVANARAPFSDKSFSRLSLQARSDATIEACLIGRGDLPEMVIRFLVENGSPGVRDALAARIPVRRPRELGCDALPIRAAEDGWLDAYDFEAAAAILDRMHEIHNHVDTFVRRLAEADHFAEVVQVLAAVSEIRLDTMKHVLVSLDTEPFAVIARALALKTETVLELLSTGPWLHRLGPRARDATVALHRGLDPEEARARLARWVAQDARR